MPALHIGSLPLRTNLMLAPIAGYTDLAFRQVVRSVDNYSQQNSLGLAWTCLISSQAIVRHETGKVNTQWKSTHTDKPLAVQLHGGDPEVMALAARLAQEHGADMIDINMGCPATRITRQCGGASLLRSPQLAIKIARAVVNSVSIPVSAKIRLGWNYQSLITDSLPPALADAGVLAVIVHGRTATQQYTGSVDLDRIAQVVQSLKHYSNVTVIGNGDIKRPEDAKRMLEHTACHGVMIGRAALGKPWIFRDIAYYMQHNRHAPELPLDQKLTLIQNHLQNLIQRYDAPTAVNLLKNRIKRYSPNVQPWPGFKRHVHNLPSAEELNQFFTENIHHIKNHGHPTPLVHN